MATIGNRVFDFGLNVLDTEANALHICSAEPATYAAATSTLTLGSAGTFSVGAPQDAAAPDGGGREVVVAAVTDGSVSGTGTATHYAIVDTANSRLLVTGALTASQAVTTGNSFTLGSFKVGLPDPA